MTAHHINIAFTCITVFINFTLNHFVWLRITDECSESEMRIWSILLIESDLEWCIHLSKSLFSYLTKEHKNNGAPWARTSNLWIPSLTRSALRYLGRYVEGDLNGYFTAL